MSEHDEFYVGYFPKAPRGTARLLRIVIAIVAVGALSAGVVFVSAQGGFSNGVFEYGTIRTFIGTISKTPVPSLTGKVEGSPDPETTYILVAPFKHGADDLVAKHDGKSVSLRGTLVQRDRRSMIEVVPDSISAVAALPSARAVETALGEVDLVGEIVDSKCWLGVMKPGDRKTHRECASLCIRGGIPPLFIARGEKGKELVALLTSPSGAPVNEAVLPLVAEPVRIRGRLARRGDMLVLRTDPATIVRVP